MLRFAIMLVIILTIYWATMSGIYTTWIITLGVLSILAVVLLCWRMNILDAETVPYHHLPKTISYYAWLFVEIIKANVQVVRAVLSPDMEVSPTMVRIPLTPKTDTGRTIFANSITLTPGTVSVEMEENEILVHALLADMSNPEDFAEMGNRSSWSVAETLDEGEV